jgi:RHS repeat-associated protein
MKPAPAIAEITGSAITATYLTGLQLDEVLARYAGSGNNTLLTDVLGSVIAQTNDQQGIQNFYAYTPYGEVQPLGPDDNNPIQYTARENDQTGLYYYRARYYDPVLKRFISEDPIGLGGGLNPYAYVGGNPISYTDPTGENPLAVAAGIGAVVGGISGAIATGNNLGWTWSNAWTIAAGAGTGAVFGAIGGLSIGRGLIAYSTGALIGGLAGFGGNVAGQIAGGTSLSCVDWRQAGLQGAIGFFAGAVAGPAFGPYAVSNPAIVAAVLSGSASLVLNSITATNSGGFGYMNPAIINAH